jgi:hypothetical protein
MNNLSIDTNVRLWRANLTFRKKSIDFSFPLNLIILQELCLSAFGFLKKNFFYES